MARLFSTLMALVFAATVASAQANIAGSWELSINGPEGVINAAADLKQDGEQSPARLRARRAPST